MEDAYVFMDCYGGRSNTWFIGIFDGFQGTAAAQFTSKELPILILEQLETAGHPYTLSNEERAYLSGYDQGISKESHITPFSAAASKSRGTSDHPFGSIHVAFAKAFWKMDRMLRLGRNESSKVRWSGCTAATCLLEPALSQSPSASASEVSGGSAAVLLEGRRWEVGTLHIANAGDVHAVLCKNGKGYRLTENHSTSNHKERNRVLRAGGSISKNERHGLVEGFIQSTRGLGFHGDPKLKTSFVPIPYTASVPIDSSCQFLVLASSGFWKVLNRYEVVSISLEMLSFYFPKAREIHSRIHSSHVMEPDDQNVNKIPAIVRLLEEFSQQGRQDVVITLKHLFEELLISKKHGWNRKNRPDLHSHLSLRKERSSLWQTLHNSLQNVATKKEYMPFNKNIIDLVSAEMENNSNIFIRSFPEDTLNEENSEDRTTVDNFPEKPALEEEVNGNRTATEHSTMELLTKEEYNDDKISVTRVAEVPSRTESLKGLHKQEDITKKSEKQKSVILSSEQIETSSLERFAVEEAYLTNQGENRKASSQKTVEEQQEIQYETLANTISKRLVETAKQAGACDNITVLILLLPGCAKSHSVK
ncbi:uncharacterized protein LOC144672851 [Cetorhinus maximus]